MASRSSRAGRTDQQLDQEGAKDDTPTSVQDPVTAENPPTYSSPPVIPALAYSPDNSLLAVSGYHEVLLHKSDGSALVGRLIGQAQRIESVAFSPDGKILGAVGGTPALFGEAQFWNVADRKLVREVPVTYDTLYGAVVQRRRQVVRLRRGR